MAEDMQVTAAWSTTRAATVIAAEASHVWWTTGG